MAIDSHTHITTLEEITEINNDPNLESVINIGLDINSSINANQISNEHNKFYSAVGIHPLYIENENPDELYSIITDKTIAIGEIGLDTTKPNLDEQKRYLIKQIIIANELKLPVIIHSNNSNHEIIKIFKNIVRPLYGCVFHCFQPDLETLEYLKQYNYYISFAGRITYKTAKKSLEVLHAVDKNLFLVETDAPYISIEGRRNEPGKSSYLPVIISTIAHELKMDYEEIDKLTTQNTKTLFKKLK